MATFVNGTSPETVEMMKATSNGVFQGESPLDFALPLVILQICLVVTVTRSLAFLLRPMRQPRVVAEIIVSPRSTALNLFYNFRFNDLYRRSGCLSRELIMVTSNFFLVSFVQSLLLLELEREIVTN